LVYGIKKWKLLKLSKLIKKNIISELKYVYSENNTLSIIFQNNDLLLGVAGEFNNNLKELEKITNTSLYSRGNSILVKSDPEKNNLIKNAIQFLTEQFLNNGTIEKKDIISSINKFMINEKNNTEKKIEYIENRCTKMEYQKHFLKVRQAFPVLQD